MERKGIEKSQCTTSGVVVCILDEEQRVFTVQELEDKNETSRTKGQYGVIGETREKGEEEANTLIRALLEETGAPPEIFTKDFFDYTQTRAYETCFLKEKRVWATVVVLKCVKPIKFMTLVGTYRDPHQVEPVGFKTKDEFEKLDLRPGMRNVFNELGDEIFKPWNT